MHPPQIRSRNGNRILEFRREEKIKNAGTQTDKNITDKRKNRRESARGHPLRENPGREIIFNGNPRKIERAKITKEGYRLKLELTIDGEEKELYTGYKNWKQNDLYPEDFTKRYHCAAYAMDEDALYLSVGLINTSYREEYCLWVNSEDKVIGTWRPNVTYLPDFGSTFENMEDLEE